jgi:putative chitinase
VIDRKVFFDTVRGSLFKGGLSQPEVNGMNAILDEWEKRSTQSTSAGWPTCSPPPSTRRPHHAADREYGRGRGTKYATTYYGRGFVQLTWETNYAKASKVVGVDLVKFPDRALMLPDGATVLFDGMINGWFTGKKLADYISGATCDYERPPDHQRHRQGRSLIAGYAMSFQKAMELAQSPQPRRAVRRGDRSCAKHHLRQKNAPTPVPVTAKDGFWANLIALLKSLFKVLMIMLHLENWTSVIAVVVATRRRRQQGRQDHQVPEGRRGPRGRRQGHQRLQDLTLNPGHRLCEGTRPGSVAPPEGAL